MFENLSDKLESAFKKLRGHGKLDEKNIDEGLTCAAAPWGRR